MSALTIDRIGIRQDEAGRYCLNDLHKAAGGEPKHQPSNWLRLESTRALCAEIDRSSEVRNALNVIQGGTFQGTYVAKELVYAYAMWISPSFHLRVIRAYDAMATRRAPALPDFTDPAAAAEAWATQYRATEAAKLEAAQAKERIQVLEPRAAALQRISEADGALCLTDAAKALQLAPRAFIRRLADSGWIYRRGSGWSAHQARIDAGLMTLKVTKIGYDADDRPRVAHQALVTPKGLASLARKIEGAAYQTRLPSAAN